MELNLKQIEEILPHRYPFLLIDRVFDLEPGIKAKAIKNVTRNEPFFNGHFPGEPIMPGVLMVEAMAQLGGIVALTASQDHKGKLAFFATIDNVRFRKPVVPGDQLIFMVETIKLKGIVAKMSGKGFVDGTLVVESEFMFSLINAQVNDNKQIDKTACIDPNAKIGKNVKIGPYSIIGENVIIGDNVTIDSHVMLKNANIGNDCKIHYGAVIGDTPQDLSFKNEESMVLIGDRTEIREYVTIHRASGNNKTTDIGSDCLICSSVHIAHNCQIGNKVVIVSNVALAGYVEVGNRAVIGGMAGIVQFAKIGELAMVGGYARIVQDVPPFMLVEGSPAYVHGINIVGLQRNNIAAKAITEIKQLYKLLYRSELNFKQAIDSFMEKKESDELSPEIISVLDFIKNSKKGISKKQRKTEEEIEADYYERFESEGLFSKLKLF